jgi:hypothetical protein
MQLQRNRFDKFAAGATLLTGIALLLAPWLFGYAQVATAAAASWLLGLVVTITAVLAISGSAPWGGLILVFTGLVALLAPVLFGFMIMLAPLAVHTVAGLLVLIQGYVLFRLRGPDIA